jgi:hypothetical protein
MGQDQDRRWFFQRWAAALGRRLSQVTIDPIGAWIETSSITEKTGAVLGSIAVFFCITLCCALLAIIPAGGATVAEVVSVIRDLFLILLAMQGMFISIALIVMILQLATLINLLENEIHPIVRNLQETTQTLRGTTKFLSENISTPVIETKAWASGLGAFWREIRGIGQAIKPQPPTAPPPAASPPPEKTSPPTAAPLPETPAENTAASSPPPAAVDAKSEDKGTGEDKNDNAKTTP